MHTLSNTPSVSGIIPSTEGPDSFQQFEAPRNWSPGAVMLGWRVYLAGLTLSLAGCVSPPENDAEQAAKYSGFDPVTKRVSEAVYPLSGNGSVAVQTPFGKEIYSAVVTMTGGEYPGNNQVAHDVGRDEFLSALDGHFVVTLNGEEVPLSAGQNVLIRDGDYYTFSGTGHCLVLVRDSAGGKTEILPKTK